MVPDGPSLAFEPVSQLTESNDTPACQEPMVAYGTQDLELWHSDSPCWLLCECVCVSARGYERAVVQNNHINNHFSICYRGKEMDGVWLPLKPPYVYICEIPAETCIKCFTGNTHPKTLVIHWGITHAESYIYTAMTLKPVHQSGRHSHTGEREIYKQLQWRVAMATASL